MRRVRWLALCVLAAALLTGCANPSGVDGDLTDDWPALPEARPFAPESGVCHAGEKALTEASRGIYAPLDCAGRHGAETVHVGQFTGADAERATMPERGSAPTRAAFAECDAKAKEYVGGDWRTALLKLDLVLPSLQSWAGGGRWFRCDLRQTGAFDSAGESRTGPLKDALAKEPRLLLRCYRPVLSNDRRLVDLINPVACTGPHRVEFAGVWTAPDTSYTDFVQNTDRSHAACLGVVAAFAKVPHDRDIEYRVGTIFYPPHEEEWRTGYRGVRCFLWSWADVRRPLKGAGPGVLPRR